MDDMKEKIEEKIKKSSEICEKLEQIAISELTERPKEKVDYHGLGEVVDMMKDCSEIAKNTAEKIYYCKIIEAMEEAGEEKEEEEKYMLRQMKEQYGEDEGQRYYNDWRYKNGRYAPKGRGTRSYPYMYMPDPEWDRDMDKGYGRMYYTESRPTSANNSSGTNSENNRSYSEGYSDGNKRGYDEGYKRGYDEGSRRGYSESKNSSSGMNSNSRYDNAKRSYEDSKTMHAGNTAEDNNANVRKIEELMDIISEDMKELLPKMTPSEKTALKSRMQTLTTHVQ